MLYTIAELGNIFKINYRHMLEYRKFLTPSNTVISLKNMDVMTYDINLAKTSLNENGIELIDDIKHDLNKIYNYISKNKTNVLSFTQSPYSFLYKKGLLDIFNFINKSDSKKEIQQKIYDHIFTDSHKCIICNSETKFVSISQGYTKTCLSKKCDYKLRSNRMSGSLNSCHKMSEETKYATYKKQSISMKKLIKNGSFTPPITNSWANSRSKIKIDGTIYKFRSTWEAMFWALNTSFQYEKTRISYKDDKNIEHIYIVDFTSEHDKKIIEIKPNRNRKINKNILKEKSAIKWAKENGYEYIIIGEEYFYENYNILYDFFKNNKKIKNALERIKSNENKKNRINQDIK